MLSIAIATFNEEKNIIRCLKSVYDWVDEIIVVDGTSTDKTVEIIKKFDQRQKIKIYLEDNPPMFHINKQKAIDRCTKEWILQLDADEVVSEELRREIAQLLNCSIADKTKRQKNNLPGLTQLRKIRTWQVNARGETATANVAYWLPRLNFFLGKPLKKGGQYPDYTLRLYRKGVAKFPCKSVHEQVEIISNSKFKIPACAEASAGRQNSKLSPQMRDPAQAGQLKIKNLDIKNSLEIRNLKLEIGYLKSPLLHYPYPTFEEYLNKWGRYTSLEAENLKKQGFKPSFFNFIKYFFILPKIWFFKTYFRQLGFLDGFPGFVFSLFSAIRYWGIYIKTVF
jgi:glycosyltransferase involved in cell wall biosynthesis